MKKNEKDFRDEAYEILKLSNIALRLSDGEISTEDAFSISMLELLDNLDDD